MCYLGSILLSTLTCFPVRADANKMTEWILFSPPDEVFENGKNIIDQTSLQVSFQYSRISHFLPGPVLPVKLPLHITPPPLAFVPVQCLIYISYKSRNTLKHQQPATLTCFRSKFMDVFVSVNENYSICELNNSTGSFPPAPHTLIGSSTPSPRLNEKSFSDLLSQSGFVIVVPYSDHCWLRNCIPV